MPITVPIPDARFRAAALDRLRRGRPLPFPDRGTLLRSLWSYRRTRWALIAGVVGILASTAAPGWLSLAVANIGQWWCLAVVVWLVVRYVQHAQRRLYVIARARSAAGAIA